MTAPIDFLGAELLSAITISVSDVVTMQRVILYYLKPKITQTGVGWCLVRASQAAVDRLIRSVKMGNLIEV